MKILWINWMDITNPASGGAEVHLHEIAKRLVKWGHEITILCSKYRGCKDRQKIDGVEVIRKGGWYSFYIYVPWICWKRLRKRNYDVIIDDVNKVPFFTPIFVRRPIVVITHHFFSGVYFKEVPPLLSPIVFILEKTFPLFYKRKIVVAQSKNTEKELIGMGIPEAHIKLIRTGLDHDSYKPSISSKSKFPSVVYCGMIKKYKNINHLVKAMAVVKKVIPEVKLFIAGKGKYDELQKLAGDLNLTSSVEFLGKVCERKKVRLFQNSWVSVHPSSKEGWGLTVIESNACGTPTIGYDVLGLRESIRKGETGILVPYGDIGGLAKAIIKLLSDKKLRDRLTKNAIKWASNFSWDKTVKEFVSVLEAVAGG